MDLTKLYRVLVIGGALAAGCGTVPSKAGNAADPANDTNTITAADAGTAAVDGGEVVADAGDVVADAGEEEGPDDAGGVCPWAGMNPCPC